MAAPALSFWSGATHSSSSPIIRRARSHSLRKAFPKGPGIRIAYKRGNLRHGSFSLPKHGRAGIDANPLPELTWRHTQRAPETPHQGVVTDGQAVSKVCDWEARRKLLLQDQLCSRNERVLRKPPGKGRRSAAKPLSQSKPLKRIFGDCLSHELRCKFCTFRTVGAGQNTAGGNRDGVRRCNGDVRKSRLDVIHEPEGERDRSPLDHPGSQQMGDCCPTRTNDSPLFPHPPEPVLQRPGLVDQTNQLAWVRNLEGWQENKPRA